MIPFPNRANYATDLDLKIDLGSGINPKEGFIGVDVRDNGQEVLWDITKGFPFPDNSVSEIYSSHFIEHIGIDDLDYLFYEMLRVSKSGAVWEHRCPRAGTLEAMYISHTSMWNEDRWKGICRGLVGGDYGSIELLSSNNEGIEIIAKLKVTK